MATTKKTGSPGRILVRGRSLLVRTSGSPRAGKTFFPPDAVIDEYVRFADEHNGRVLWTMGRMKMSTLEHTQNVILYSSGSGNAMVGRIVGAGRQYDPERWAESHSDDMDFMAPEPWASEKASMWVALEQVRFGHILLSDYRPTNSDRELKELMVGAGSGKVLIDCIRS